MFDKTQACVGDVVTCPIHGLTRVTEGVKAFTIAGRAMSHIGHRTACGAIITTGSDFYFLNGAGAALEGSETDHGGLVLRNRFHTDLPWNFHPTESRAWGKVTLFGAV